MAKKDTQGTQEFTAEALVISNDHAPPSIFDIVVEAKPQGNAHICYDPSSLMKAKFKKAVQVALKDIENQDSPLFKGPIKLTIVFNILNMLKESIDNLLKLVLDTLEKIVYKKDLIMHKFVIEK
jgi:Holliday junction resolvase RusA-like endonuclease